MKTLDLFIVELDKQTNDTMVTEGGLELFIDTKFNEFEHRVTEGPIVSVPSKYNTGAKPGDTLYFHHLVVMNEGQRLTGNDKHFLVRYNDEETISNQAIAYKSKETDQIHLLSGWSLLLPHLEDKEEDDAVGIDMVKLEEELPTKGVVAFESKVLDAVGVQPGDVVGFAKNRDYRIKIEGIEYYRTRVEDLLYVEK